MVDEALMFHIDQKESANDVHVRFSCEEARELLDVLIARCKTPEASDNLRYVITGVLVTGEALRGEVPVEGSSVARRGSGGRCLILRGRGG